MIRRAETAADLDAYARVWSEVHPDTPISGEEVQRRLAESDDGRQYLVAGADGHVVGTGFASRTSTPGRAAALVAVLAAFRRRGIGSALLDASLARARELGASVASGSLSEAALPWAERRGFEAFDREVELVLDLTGHEQPPVAPEGFVIGELDEGDLDDAYRVYAEGVADIPSSEQLAASFERCRAPRHRRSRRPPGCRLRATRTAHERRPGTRTDRRGAHAPSTRHRQGAQADTDRVGGGARLSTLDHGHALGKRGDPTPQRIARLPGAPAARLGA
jgi:GNAT superfamily N-acetyltransferase